MSQTFVHRRAALAYMAAERTSEFPEAAAALLKESGDDLAIQENAVKATAAVFAHVPAEKSLVLMKAVAGTGRFCRKSPSLQEIFFHAALEAVAAMVRLNKQVTQPFMLNLVEGLGGALMPAASYADTAADGTRVVVTVNAAKEIHTGVLAPSREGVFTIGRFHGTGAEIAQASMARHGAGATATAYYETRVQVLNALFTATGLPSLASTVPGLSSKAASIPS